VVRFANDPASQVRRDVAMYIGSIYCDRSKSIPPRFMRLLHKLNAERSHTVRWGASLALELVRGPTPEERAERRAWLAKQRKKKAAHKLRRQRIQSGGRVSSTATPPKEN